MVNRVRRIKNLIVGGVACIILTACGPRYVPAETLSGYASTGSYGGAHAQDSYSQSGYSHTGHAHTGYAQAKSRYGHAFAGGQSGLQPPCSAAHTPCGFTRVLPVYPVYQYVTAQETIVEAPTVSVPEPAPIVVYEPAPEPIPEPVYTPSIQHWPEPDVDVPSWKPLRK